MLPASSGLRWPRVTVRCPARGMSGGRGRGVVAGGPDRFFVASDLEFFLGGREPLQSQFLARTALEVGDFGGDQLRVGARISGHHAVELDEIDARRSGRSLRLAGGKGEQDAKRRGDVLALARSLDT